MTGKNTTPSLEMGKRIRIERNNRGWSQEELAARCNVAKNTVSNWENNGLNSIDTIQELEEKIFGCSLRDDILDREGSINEVGLEILIELIRNNGKIDTTTLWKKYMCGMPEEDVHGEILKLCNLGLVVRDVFNDFFDRPQDIVLLTAKGLITCRNRVSNPVIFKELQERKVETFESRMKDKSVRGIPMASGFADYIAKRQDEKLIRQIEIKTPFEINYLLWLKRYFEFGDEKDFVLDANSLTIIPSDSLYYDTVWKMLFGIDNEKLPEILKSQCIEPYNYLREERVTITSKRQGKVFFAFFPENAYLAHHKGGISELLGMAQFSPELYDQFMRGEAPSPEEEEALEEALKDAVRTERELSPWNFLHKKFEEAKIRLSDRKAVQENPLDIEEWFTVDEICEFFSNERHQPKTEEEKRIARSIKEVQGLNPLTLEYFVPPVEFSDEEKGKWINAVKSAFGVDLEAYDAFYETHNLL